MTTYYLYGLNVQSAFQIQAEAGSTDRDADIRILNGPVELPEMRQGAAGLLYCVSGDTIYLQWNHLGSFRIKAGREITATKAPDVAETTFMRTLTGSILAIALYQRRCFVLHASAVVVDGGAVLFSGESGYGKSTIASSLHACGHHLLADDIAAIHVGDTTHQVFPGNQEFKLWPDSAKNLGEQVENLERIAPKAEKRFLPVAQRLQRHPLPVRRIYILEFGEKHEIEPIQPPQAAIELIRNTYGVTLLHQLRTADFFQQVVRLATSVPVFRLRRTRSFDHFDGFLAMVKQHQTELS